MDRLLPLAVVAILGLAASSAGAVIWPPSGPSGCGELTRSDEKPFVSVLRDGWLRYTGKARIFLPSSTQQAAATVSITQAGGRRIGGTLGFMYTCTPAPAGPSAYVALPITDYGRRLIRRHGRLSVTVTLRILNGSNVRNVVRQRVTIRPTRY